MLLSNSPREYETSHAVDVRDTSPFQEGIHNNTSSSGDEVEAIICAECGDLVSHDDLEAHRKLCYKCHLYSGICYRILDVSTYISPKLGDL